MSMPRLFGRVLGVATVVGAMRAGDVYAQQSGRDSIYVDSARATLVGRVSDTVGVGLAGAEITLFNSDRMRVITGDSGAFRITGLIAGTTTFAVRRIGYEAATFTAVLKPGKTHRAAFKLVASALALPTVAVSDTMVQSHWLDKFNSRKEHSPGVFLTRADFVRKNPRTGPDIVRSVPGIRIVPNRSGFGSSVVMTRGAAGRTCVPTMYVHGTPYSGSLDDFIADDIEALEIYVGVSEIPPELDKGGKGICGAINVWTRDPRKPPD